VVLLRGLFFVEMVIERGLRFFRRFTEGWGTGVGDDSDPIFSVRALAKTRVPSYTIGEKMATRCKPMLGPLSFTDGFIISAKLFSKS
jgi:hypothetical protein